jgi:hypothetical protein
MIEASAHPFFASSSQGKGESLKHTPPPPKENFLCAIIVFSMYGLIEV